jgi:hypothetical protein
MANEEGSGPKEAVKPADPACGTWRDYMEFEADAERDERRRNARNGEPVHRYPGEERDMGITA